MRRRQHGKKSLALFGGLQLFLVLLRPGVFYGDVVATGQKLDRPVEVQPLFLHCELYAVAALAAAVAVAKVLCRRYGERGCSFGMERAQPEKLRAVAPEFRVRLDNICDVKLPHTLYGSFANHNLLALSQQSIIALPVYLRRARLPGLTGSIRPRERSFRKVL